VLRWAAGSRWPKGERYTNMALGPLVAGQSLKMFGCAPSNARGKFPICRKLMWIILLALAARVVIRLHSGALDFWESGYTFFFALAKNIAAGNGVAFDGTSRTAFRVPLYPMFLAAVTLGHQVFFPVLLAQSLIGAGTVWCAAMLAREI